jgi:AraC family transcriptional regulator
MHSIEDVLAPAVVRSSRDRAWPGIEVMRSRNPLDALDVDGLPSHTLALNVGRPYRLEGRVAGRKVNSTMTTGFIKLVEARVRSSWRWDPGYPIDVLHVSVDDGALRAAADELEAQRMPEIKTRVAFESANLTRIAHALHEQLHRPPEMSLLTDALRLELILRLIGEHSSLAGQSVVRLPSNRLASSTLRSLDDFIASELANEINIDQLAAIAGVSRFHFARMFRATVGTTPYRYVLNFRLERARRMLRANRHALRDIAAATGFADQSHLSRRVKRRFGVTPAELRAG